MTIASLNSTARANSDMRAVINALKDGINGALVDWEECKLVTNPYERVHATSPCVASAPYRQPCSRAFFKMWEIMHTARPECLFGGAADAPLRAAYLAEAPGGFVEAVVTLRQRCARDSDQHHAMSLSNACFSHNIPVWKLPGAWCRANNISIHGGADGTGNLLDRANVDSLLAAVGGENRCHIVTADGGFDFSGDFNNQELNMLPMIRAETAAALRLVAPTGLAVIKIFDAYLPETRAALRLFRSCFSTSSVVKPVTSRPANSERYLVASGLLPDAAHRRLCVERLYALNAPDAPDAPDAQDGEDTATLQTLQTLQTLETESAGELLADDAFGTTLGNLRAGVQQMKSILETLELVKKRAAGDRDTGAACLDRQHACREAWLAAYPLRGKPKN
jgi:hypothetical protein